jgi:hypothetical protein
MKFANLSGKNSILKNNMKRCVGFGSWNHD